MEEMKVIFRKAHNPYTKEDEVVAFFPTQKANYGNIVSYIHIGQHSESDLLFYKTTKKANEEEYKSLLNELNGVYNDCVLVVKQRLNHNDLVNKAWK